MLKYNLSQREFGIDIINVEYDNFIITEDFDVKAILYMLHLHQIMNY